MNVQSVRIAVRLVEMAGDCAGTATTVRKVPTHSIGLIEINRDQKEEKEEAHKWLEPVHHVGHSGGVKDDVALKAKGELNGKKLSR